MKTSISIQYPDLDHFVVKGSWYDIGQTHGRKEQAMVRYIVRRYTVFHDGSRRLKVLPEFIRKSERFLAKHFPRELAELHGIADGAKVQFELLLACNFLDAVNSLVAPHVAPARASECSNIMFPDSEWGPLIGGTLDDDPTHFLMTVHPDDGIPFCGVMWPGWVFGTWGGMNAKGLAVCGASSSALREKNKRVDQRIIGLDAVAGPPKVLLCSCATVAEALERLSEPDLMAYNNYSIMDASGRGVQVQGYHGNTFKLRVVEMATDTGLCCGNFFTWELSEKDFAKFPQYKAKFKRYQCLQRTVKEYQGKYAIDAMKHVLTSHEGDPRLLEIASYGDPVRLESICNHNTDVAMVAAPTRQKLWFATKSPCLQGFKDYSLK